ncbi:MAG: uridylate kinase, partial [Geminicoccaceae bacterium]
TVGFDDRTADRMALLAMNQYGLMLVGLEPALLPVERLDDLHAPQEGGRVPLWLPYAAIAGRDHLKASWDVTSDSLALWLARELDAARLVLVKSAALPHGPASVDELIQAGILDPAFAGLAPSYAGDIFCLWRGSYDLFARALRGKQRLQPLLRGPPA